MPGPHAQRALLLFSHGSSDPEWTLPFIKLQDILADSHPDTPVTLAFLDPAKPNFDDVVAQLAQSGVKEIVVAPLFLARGSHVKRDLPALVEKASAHYGMTFRVLPTLGEVDGVLEAIAASISEAALKP